MVLSAAVARTRKDNPVHLTWYPEPLWQLCVPVLAHLMSGDLQMTHRDLSHFNLACCSVLSLYLLLCRGSRIALFEC